MLTSTRPNTPPMPHFGNTAVTTNTSQPVNLQIEKSQTSIPPVQKTDEAEFSQGQQDVKASTPSIWELPSVEWTQKTVDSKSMFSNQQDIMQHLHVQSMQYPASNGNLKLLLNEAYEPEFLMQSSGIANTFKLLDRPVDVIVKSNTGKAGLTALMTTRGRTFMAPSASITIASTPEGKHHQTTSDLQIQRWTSEQENQILASYILKKAGMKSDQRDAMVSTLKAQKGRKSWNGLQALYEGQNGLVDGILAGRDQVVTRSDLDSYIKLQGWDKAKPDDKKKIEEFIQNCYTNLSKLSSRPLVEVFPETLPKEKTNALVSTDQRKVRIKHAKAAHSELQQAFPKTPIDQGKHIVLEGSALVPNHHYNIQYPPHLAKPASILSNDGVFFADQVDTQSINKVALALEKLDAKRIKQQSNHHIPLYLISPGGSIPSGNAFQDILERLKTPVDIIVTGTSASAGVMHLLLAATGDRWAAPHSFLMLHETATIGAKASEVGEDVDQGFHARIQRIAEKVGRSVEEVRKDVTKDYYLNVLEGLLYGSNGLITGILVGPDRVITRSEVMPYLIEKLGSEEKVKQALQKRLEGRRYVEEELRNKFNADDPFTNYLQTIEAVAKRGTRKLGEHPDFKHSGPDLKSSSLSYMSVKQEHSLIKLVLTLFASFGK